MEKYSMFESLLSAKHCADLPGFDSHDAEAVAGELMDLIDDRLLDHLCWTFEHPMCAASGASRGIGQNAQAGIASSPTSSASDTIVATVPSPGTVSARRSQDPSPYTRLGWSCFAADTAIQDLSGTQLSPLSLQHDCHPCHQASPTQAAALQNGSPASAQEHNIKYESSYEPWLSGSEADEPVPAKPALEPHSKAPCTHNHQKNGRSRKRGRPPKTPGVFSKGYMAIKRYRQRKKGMVEQMECDVAAKQEELAVLQREHSQLVLRQQVLEVAVAAQEAVLTQLAQLKLSMDIPDSSSTSRGTDCCRTAAQTAAVLDRALAAVGSSSSGPAAAVDWMFVLQHTEAELQRLKQYSQLQRVQSSSVALDIYKAYVADSALKLAQEVSLGLPESQQTTAALAAAAAAAVTGAKPGLCFADFPLSAVESALLWDPARTGTAAQLPLPDVVAQHPSSLELVSINLENGRYEMIPGDFWRQVACQVTVQPYQVQQLDSAWELFAAAQVQLDQQRQQLLLQLQLYAAVEAVASPAAAANAALSAVGDGYQVGLQMVSAVEAYMLAARVNTLAYSWCLKSIFTNDQVAKMCVACWPFYGIPHMRTIVGHILGKF